MKRFALASMFGLAAILCPLLLAAEKKTPDKMTMEALMSEVTGGAGPSDGINAVIWLPPGFWQIAMDQCKDVRKEDARGVITALEPYMILMVARADVAAPSVFTFHPQKAVANNLTVTWIDKDHEEHPLKPEEKLTDEMETVIRVIRPIAKNFAGPLGDNMHIFVYRNADPDGKVRISPYEKGKLRVEMKKYSKEAGGVVEFECPLNSLFVPRKCETCKKDMHISWGYCPWCGKKLPE